MLELLYTPEDCILYKHPLFELIQETNRNLPLVSKLCKDTFANYAFTQIKKAKGLNKKINNPMDKERKLVEDFCWVKEEYKTVLFSEYMKSKKLESLHIGLSKIPNMKNCFHVFYAEDKGYKGLAKENANELNLSSIAKGEVPIAMLYFNMEGYSSYYKKYREYWNWVEKRSEARYQNNIEHQKNYDSKNLMHTFRLLHMAEEIAKHQKINVRCSLIEREYLFRIKNGEFEYDELLREAEAIRKELEDFYKQSELQEKPDLKKINHLLFDIRERFYENNY